MGRTPGLVAGAGWHQAEIRRCVEDDEVSRRAIHGTTRYPERRIASGLTDEIHAPSPRPVLQGGAPPGFHPGRRAQPGSFAHSTWATYRRTGIDDSMAPAYLGLGAGRGEFLDEAAVRVEVAVDVVV